MTYTIYELQNLQSSRQGTTFKGTLRAAKAKASKDQMFQGTVLKITDSYGNTVSTKSGKKWVDYQ